MIESLVLGLVQGIAEWLPISSEGMVVAIKNTFFPRGETLTTLLRLSLFLHLGTFLAALVYFRKEVMTLLRTLTRIKRERDTENGRVVTFLLISTLISGVLGIGILSLIEKFEGKLLAGSAVINVVIALMLFFTAYLQMRSKRDGLRDALDLRLSDGVVLGIAQGFATLPGLSRSGLTVSTLLLRKFDDALSLKLSFLMSLPIVLAGNIVLNREMLMTGFTLEMLVALTASFLAGIITIDVLLRTARKVNFAYFTAGFGVLLLVSIII